MQEEVSVLLGKSLTFSEPETALLTKEDHFSEPGGKIVLSHVILEGDLQGHGCLTVPIRDAIRIGGTLIMLPESELEAVVTSEEYTEELQDSYGEIANIICGSLTSIFEEQYPKSFRLVRTEQEVILPVKVDPEADDPVPPGTYYRMSSAMALEGTEMGTLVLLLPAASFGLVEEEQDKGDKDTADSGPAAIDRGKVEQPEQPDVIQRPQADDQVEKTAGESRNTPAAAPPDAGGGGETGTTAAAPVSRVDLDKRRERIDRLLSACLEKIGEEVGVLLGGTLKITPEENVICTKEEFLEQAGGKQVLARMDVRGDAEGEAFLFVPLKDAIFLGGTLIMLPDPELEEVVRNEEFGTDAEDAYGEIANIIAGVYTAVFEEQYRDKLGFVKTGLETVVPVKIDPDGDEVFPAGLYYLQAGEISYNEQKLGRLQTIFPASLFGLEGLAAEAEEPAPSSSQKNAAKEEDRSASAPSTAAPEPLQPQETEISDILVFTDDDSEARSLETILGGLGYHPRILHFRDPVAQYLTDSIKLVFLVMREVNEQGLGMAIKLSTHGLRVPLVAAAPAWTRTAVLRAVKYGATDILITPAVEEDVREKVENNLVRKAA